MLIETFVHLLATLQNRYAQRFRIQNFNKDFSVKVY